MKIEHIEMVWESIAQFQKSSINFWDFLDRLGKSLESANLEEAKIIGEASRELDFVLAAEPWHKRKIERITGNLRNKLQTQLKLNSH